MNVQSDGDGTAPAGHLSTAPADLAGPAEALEAGLRAASARIARVPSLLVACDYDGTLAPIVEDPTRAAPLPEAVAALRALASLPQTTVAVISGRALRDLAALSRLPSEVHLVGSHGSEFDVGFVDALAPDLQQLRGELVETLSGLVRRRPGVRLELKPASVAVHFRAAEPEVAHLVLESILTGPATWPGVTVTQGKQVVELSVITTNKGLAIDALRTQLSASAVVFLGDDVTDENAFAHLHGPDLGVKIGPGDTRAHFRVSGPVDAVRLLGLLLHYRRQWLFGERAVPIERHSMLSNGRTVALVTPDARVSWLCHPRPDSSALFADLLGGPSAGHFTVKPERGGLPLGQRYLPGTMTVETRWSGLTITDWLDTHPTNGAGLALSDNQGTALIRVLSGTARAKIVFAPRPEFGQLPIRLQPLGDGLLVLGSNEPIALYSPGVDWDIVTDSGNEVGRAFVDLSAMGGSAVLELRLGTADVEAHPVDADKRRTLAEEQSRDWAMSLRLPVRARDAVLRSALTLRGLCHEPTGAILAAATASLPEEIGGVRNWDYRYCWLRDAAMSARVLVDLGSTEEADRLLNWTMRVVESTGGHPERLHPLYAVDGNELGAEAVIDTLPGYAGSRPVRVGNAANRQVQLDVFGPVADLIAAVADHRGLHPEDVALMGAMVEAVERRWHEPDHGLWEARLPPRHHVYSKVMCWLTVDRAIQLGSKHGMPIKPEWRKLRDTIAENVLAHGWHEKAGAYTVAYGDRDLDASSLWIGLSGLLADDDPRFLSTVLAIEAELRSGATVYRYLWDDGLPGHEGGFHICTAWLIEAYLRTGRRTEAEELFDQMLDTAGPTGLLPEQYDPEAERGLGNHPQAYSHLGLIRCAMLLDAAR
ncbi:trehalose-phosphatase [Planosporangium flavigriseum]|uniref:Trehalose-phosphatase n=1 Tax=Planosporangium flavigriseum TaxID=373681 RepID=A0A8J3LYI7_9ACTN|nr:trehalose-phosphatase [Planosporangium flavigriseum]NJC67191.1 trehalose-phosphatase [Planosporangium flavigriseum]GIG76119.1 trehalose-phosphatase [Planosporangium flavigriseum]